VVAGVNTRFTFISARFLVGVWDSTNAAALEMEGHFWKAKACNVHSLELGREEIK